MEWETTKKCGKIKGKINPDEPSRQPYTKCKVVKKSWNVLSTKVIKCKIIR